MANDKCSFDIDFLQTHFTDCKEQMKTQYNNSDKDTLYIIEDIASNTRLCSKSEGKIYKNCVIESDNPWLVRSGDNDNCIYPKNMTLPEQLYRNDSNLKSDSIDHEVKNILQERWYDWFTIPDYYHGNMYYLDKSDDENKIYEPCDLGKVPYPKDLKKCISKNDINYGLYTNQISYTPLQLVLLYGYSYDSNLVTKKLGELRNSFKTNLENSEDYEFLKSQEEKQKITDFDNSYLNINANEHYTEIQTTVEKLTDIELNDIKAPIQNVIKVSDFIHSKENIIDAWELCSEIKPKIETKITEPDNKLTESEKKFYKACDICFNGNSFYSKNVILFRLNEGESDKKQSLKFEKILDDSYKKEDSSTTSETQISMNNTGFNLIDYKTEKGFSQQKYSKYLLSVVKIMVALTFITFISIFVVLILLAFKKQLIPFYESMFSSVSSAGNMLRNLIAAK